MAETKTKPKKKATTTKKTTTRPNNAKLLKVANMKVSFLEEKLDNTRMWNAAWCIIAVGSIAVNLYLLYV